jgi:hypothetical protein
MSIDPEIFVEADRSAELRIVLPNGFSMGAVDLPYLDGDTEWPPKGATHKVDSGGHRYYDIGYERGQWPPICAALMALIASPDVQHVWYCGDSDDAPRVWSTPTPCDAERVLRISAHYMRVANRPFFQPA